LLGGNTYIDAVVADHVIEEANRKLSDSVRRNFEEPEQHLQWFCKLARYNDGHKKMTATGWTMATVMTATKRKATNQDTDGHRP